MPTNALIKRKKERKKEKRKKKEEKKERKKGRKKWRKRAFNGASNTFERVLRILVHFFDVKLLNTCELLVVSHEQFKVFDNFSILYCIQLLNY